MDEMREAFPEFLAESLESLDRLDRDLVAIEADPAEHSTIDSIFRTIHTLKGTSGFFDLPRLGRIAHAGESLLGQLRDRSIDWDAEITTALLGLSDAVRRELEAIDATGVEGLEDHAGLIEVLQRFQDRSGSKPTVVSDPVATKLPGLKPTIHRNPIRVDVGLLDRLMDLVGELVLTRNQLLRHSTTLHDTELAGTSSRLDQVTSALQEGVMRARMRPIGLTWDPLPRVVRDLALTCGKSVRLELEGKATELDRTILEAIKDPITHLIRNAIDHGIESPLDRQNRGKPSTGRLRLKASHRGGLVHVEIEDDGAGIDPARVAGKALERGLITREQAARLDESEAVALLFKPGFSTTDTITQVSGRGVGLDVVRANIEAVGGTVEVRSRLGLGTVVDIKIPLTLAIIPSLIIEDGPGDRYAIPQTALVELIRLEGLDVVQVIEPIGGAAFLRLQGQLVPLIDLDHVFGASRPDLMDRSSLDVVVLQADGRRFGLVVQAILDTEEIVVKPLGRSLRSISLFAGATILGDGRVALILDVPGLARSAGVSAIAAELPVRSEVSTPVEDRRSYLLAGLAGGRRLAFPLAEVARLQEVPGSSVGRASGLEVIEHQGRLLPLIRLDGPSLEACPGPLRVVVCQPQGGRSIGLVVDSILDIVEAEPRLESLNSTPGLLGSAMFCNQVADLVDVTGLIADLASGGTGS